MNTTTATQLTAVATICAWGAHRTSPAPLAIGTTPNGVSICAGCAPLSGLRVAPLA